MSIPKTFLPVFLLFSQQNQINIIDSMKKCKKYFRGDEILYLENSTVKCLHTTYFKSKVLQFISSAILIFDAKMFKIQEDDYVVILHQMQKVSIFVSLKLLLTEHLELFILQLMSKRMLMDSNNNKKMAHFQVGYILYPDLKQKRTFQEQLQKKWPQTQHRCTQFRHDE